MIIKNKEKKNYLFIIIIIFNNRLHFSSSVRNLKNEVDCSTNDRASHVDRGVLAKGRERNSHRRSYLNRQ